MNVDLGWWDFQKPLKSDSFSLRISNLARFHCDGIAGPVCNSYVGSRAMYLLLRHSEADKQTLLVSRGFSRVEIFFRFQNPLAE
jgi:hypothetical protein